MNERMDCFAALAMTTLVMPGQKRVSALGDPGIHQSAKKFLKVMDYRVKPGNDGCAGTTSGKCRTCGPYPSNTASAPFTASALSITVRSKAGACTEMFSAKNLASVT